MTLDRRRMPDTLPSPGLRFPRPTRVALAPGLDLCAVERRDLPLVHFVWLWHGGSAADAPSDAGLSALTADMLDEGTADLTMAGFHEALARIGGHLDTDIGHDATVLSLTALSAHADRAFALLADMATRPRLDGSDFERVRGLRLNRVRQVRHSASALADLVAMQHLYGTHAYGRPALGTEASLTAFTVDDVRERHAACLQTRATLIAVGDIDAAAFEALVRAHVPAHPRTASTPDYGAVPADGSRMVFVPRRGAAQSEIRVGRIAVARSSSDYHALVVLNTLAGGAFVSRINTRLREEKGVTYGARSAFQFLRQPGPFLVHSSVQTSATAASVGDVLGELEALGGDRPVGADELAQAQGSLTLGYARGFETAEQIARGLAQLALFDLPDDTFERFVERVNAVTAEQVTALARRWFQSAALHAVVVGDPDTARAGLDALGLGAVDERLADELLRQ